MSHDTGLVGQQGSNELPDLRIGVLAFAATELPGGVFLDWRRGDIGDLAPCVVCVVCPVPVPGQGQALPQGLR
jgi:hypothetical protein